MRLSELIRKLQDLDEILAGDPIVTVLSGEEGGVPDGTPVTDVKEYQGGVYINI